LEPFANHRRPADDKTGVKLKGKLAKVIAILRRIGRRLADALRWVRLRVAGPVHSLQSSIVTRPKVSWLLTRAVDIAFWLQHLELSGESGQERALRVLSQLIPIDAEPPADATDDQREAYSRTLLGSVGSQVTAETGDFKTRLDAMLEHLTEGALPGVIIPLENIFEWLIDFFLSRLGAKVKLAKGLLQHTDVYQRLTGKIASELGDMVEGSALDPNMYWQKYVLDTIDDQLRGVRNNLVGEIYKRTNVLAENTGITFLGLGKPDIKQKGQFGLKREGDPMAEPYTVHGAVPKRGRLAELPATPGQPLAAAVRLIEERRFGHDLRHVRLHTGAETGSNLNKIGAKAVTSGSHVFFRPGLDPRSALGARVLRHELTHVLQQTGPRPRGRVHEMRPVRGRPRKGLVVDQMREAAAETMANADAAAVAREPVEVNAGAEGMQPNFEGAVTSVLGKLTTFQSASDFDMPTGGKAVPGEPEAKHAWKQVHDLVVNRKFQSQPFVKNVINQIAAHIVATVHDTDIPRVAALGQKPAKGARGKKPKNTQLDFQRFVTLLEGFIFAKSGVAMQIKISDPPSLTLKSVEVTYVHFGTISPTSPTGSALWDAVMKATPSLAAGDDQTKLRAEVYARLDVLGPDPFVWKTGRSEFRFSEEFVEAFNKVRVRGRKQELEADLPVVGPKPDADPKVEPKPKDEYLNPSGQKGIGVRVGIHKAQKGTDRESHHTTQYLLVQYFRNNNSVKAWRAGVEYPGIKPTTGKERELFQAQGRKALQLKALDDTPSSRGAGMPAVLLSADLHKRGRLHVNRESRWTGKEEDPDSDEEQGGGASRQGFAIEHVFKAALKDKFGVRDDSPEWAKAVELKGKPAAASLIQDAMIETYHWMHGIMLPALEQGLNRELAYYRGIAARRHLVRGASDEPRLEPDYDLKAGDMNSVYARAKANNDKVMSDAGWPAD